MHSASGRQRIAQCQGSNSWNLRKPLLQAVIERAKLSRIGVVLTVEDKRSGDQTLALKADGLRFQLS